MSFVIIKQMSCVRKEIKTVGVVGTVVSEVCAIPHTLGEACRPTSVDVTDPFPDEGCDLMNVLFLFQCKTLPLLGSSPVWFQVGPSGFVTSICTGLNWTLIGSRLEVVSIL